MILDLLAGHGIQALADVRRFPGSRRHPQFAQDALSASLEADGITYRWLPALGGRRRPRPNSPNTAWRNASFRGYADHLYSEEFSRGLEELLEPQRRIANDAYVCRSPMVAMPPCADCRCAALPRHRSGAYRR